MTANEARDAADKLLETMDKKEHMMSFVEATQSTRHAGHWNVVYDLFSPQGTLIDGPIVIIVSELNAEARLMEGP